MRVKERITLKDFRKQIPEFTVGQGQSILEHYELFVERVGVNEFHALFDGYFEGWHEVYIKMDGEVLEHFECFSKYCAEERAKNQVCYHVAAFLLRLSGKNTRKPKIEFVDLDTAVNFHSNDELKQYVLYLMKRDYKFRHKFLKHLGEKPE